MRSVVVTGASTGIGQACALRLAREGWHVFAGVRKAVDAERLRAGAQGRIEPVMLDVTDADSIREMVARVGTSVGDAGLHGLVNNAGIATGGVLESLPLDDLRRILEVNVVGQLAVLLAGHLGVGDRREHHPQRRGTDLVTRLHRGGQVGAQAVFQGTHVGHCGSLAG